MIKNCQFCGIAVERMVDKPSLGYFACFNCKTKRAREYHIVGSKKQAISPERKAEIRKIKALREARKARRVGRLMKMAEMRYSGKTLRVIAARFHITLERVRQLVGIYFPDQNYKAKIYDKICPTCKKQFTTKVKNRKYCIKTHRPRIPDWQCGRCKKTKDTTAKYCRACMSKRMKKYYKTKSGRRVILKASKRQRTKDRFKNNARANLNWHIRMGNIKKPTKCSVCFKKGKIYGHHHDYSKPLAVKWLCSGCHADEHKKISTLTPPVGMIQL